MGISGIRELADKAILRGVYYYLFRTFQYFSRMSISLDGISCFSSMSAVKHNMRCTL